MSVDLVRASDVVGKLCDRIEQLERELTAEKALADWLYEASRIYRIRAGESGNESFLDAHSAYRKARGL